jgi:uncharacterized membrane protein YecN with MAPEG domain
MNLLLQSSIYAFGFYVAVNAFIMLVLSVLVVRARVKTNTLIGDAGKSEMTGPLRAHANNTEYVPMALLMMWGLTTPLGASIWLIHGIGVPLTLGRLLHAIGLSQNTGTSMPRFIGMVLTWTAYIVGIVSLLYGVFFLQPATS